MDPMITRSGFGIQRHGNVFKSWKDIPIVCIPSRGIPKEYWPADPRMTQSRFGIPKHGNVFKPWKDIPTMCIPSCGIFKELYWLVDLGIKRSRFGSK